MLLSPDSLFALSTGGSNVAADPDSQQLETVSGPEPAGVAEACAWMARAISDQGAAPHLLFLVGGPGGGKSRAAARLVSGLEERGATDDGLVRREYRYVAAGGREVVLINDATIDKERVTDEPSSSGLAYDVENALRKGYHLIACVNRGVLVDELATLKSVGTGSQLLGWLAGTVEDGSNGSPSDYLKQRPLQLGDGPAATATAVYVDVCSLLEARPSTTVNGDALVASDYQLIHFEGANRLNTPAGALLERAVDAFVWDGEADPAWDPVRANLESLRQPAVRSGLMSLLRAGEIISGQRFTYRELWGCIARSVVGELPSLVSSSDAASHLAGNGWVSGEAPDFEQLQELARHRWFISLFGGLEPLSERAATDPVLRITAQADPLLDTSPEWATPVIDAFASSVLSSSPLEEVRRQLGDELDWAIQPFDEALDEAFARHIDQTGSHQARAEAESWYGRYLTRLFASAWGFPAFHLAVGEWVTSYRMASAVSDKLRPLLHTLLSPSRLINGHATQPLVPVFASRTDPLVGYIEQPTLARRAQTFEFTTRRDGEDLRLTVIEQGAKVGEVLLDFSLVREAMTCSHDWMGMTEASDRTSPRVERFRSQRLTSDALARNPQLAVALGDEDFTVTVSRKAST